MKRQTRYMYTSTLISPTILEVEGYVMENNQLIYWNDKLKRYLFAFKHFASSKEAKEALQKELFEKFEVEIKHFVKSVSRLENKCKSNDLAFNLQKIKNQIIDELETL